MTDQTPAARLISRANKLGLTQGPTDQLPADLAEQITFEDYCHLLGGSCDIRMLPESALPAMDEGILDRITGAFRKLKKELKLLVDELMMDAGLIMDALKQKTVFGILKAFGFSLKALLKSLNKLTGLFRKGLHKVFEELHKTGLIQAVHAGTTKVDAIMDQFPLLKKLTGPLIAALLFYIWVNMTFVGDFGYDFDWSDMAAALAGNYSLAELFTSPAGLMTVTLFATGGLVSVAWLGSTGANALLAIIYTGLQHLKGSTNPTVKRIRARMVLSAGGY